MTDSYWDYLYRRFPVFGAIVLVIAVIGCVAAIASNLSSVLGLLPLGLGLVVIAAVWWLARRWVSRRAEPAAGATVAAVADARAADAIWDAYGQKQAALHTGRLESGPTAALEREPDRLARPAARLDGRRRFTLCVLPAAITAAVVVAAMGFEIAATPDAGGQVSLSNVIQIIGACLLPVSLVAAVPLGIFGGTLSRAAAAWLGFKARGLDVITVSGAVLVAAAGVLFLDVSLFLLALS